MSPRLDLRNRRFGRLVAIEAVHTNKIGKLFWICKCDCGTTKAVCGVDLNADNIVSCGCYRVERLAKHGAYKGFSKGKKREALYGIWANMIQRCENPNNQNYDRYGERGIFPNKVWRESYADFREYINTNLGERPTKNHTLDRIDNERGYEPGNVRWATRKVQANNRTRSPESTLNRSQAAKRGWKKRRGKAGKDLAKAILDGQRPPEFLMGDGIY